MADAEVVAVVGHRCGPGSIGADDKIIRADDLGAASARHSNTGRTL